MTIDPEALAAIARAEVTSNDRLRAVRAARMEDMLPYADRVRRWLAEDTEGLTFLRDEHHVTPFFANMMDAPSGRTYALPEFFRWLRENHIEPFEQTPGDRFIPARTSPQAVFPTWLDALDAYNAWRVSTDPRLPNQMTTGSGGYQRHTGRGRDFSFPNEIRAAWDADDFGLTTDYGVSTRQSEYAAGFWRDVRDLGFGTPDWDAPTDSAARVTDLASAVKPDAPTTVDGQAIPIGPDHPGWADFWSRAREAAGERYRGYWEILAREMGGLPPRERRYVRVTVDVPIQADAATPQENSIRRARDLVSGFGLSIAPVPVTVDRTERMRG